jgi:hypothetical protein
MGGDGSLLPQRKRQDGNTDFRRSGCTCAVKWRAVPVCAIGLRRNYFDSAVHLRGWARMDHTRNQPPASWPMVSRVRRSS